ncbi:MAG TPA: hypothetical protein PK002_11415 [Cellvibrio sp.]|nr:hypothetical protein [Cellvibrio sp.]
MHYLIYVLLLLVTFFFPLWINVVLFAINYFVPDPIPYIDEILQAAIILKKATTKLKQVKQVKKTD